MADLTKLTVNLTPASVAALNATAELTGLSRTDCVNRALQLYAAVERASRQDGGEVLTIDEQLRIAVAPTEGTQTSAD